MDEAIGKMPKVHKRTRPSLHLLATVIIFGLSGIGYSAIIWSGQLHGYEPSKTVAARDLALFAPILAVFFWLTRRQKFRGEMIILTASIFLFAFGSLMQYRLFSDPEYGARGAARREAREAKAQAVRLENIRTGYDDQKKRFMFGSLEAVPEKPPRQNLPAYEKSLGDILRSVNTYIPLLALLALMAAFRIFKDDGFLLWLQRRSLIISLSVLLPFAIVVLVFSEEGKFLGQTTPWEPVKIAFLVSFAGALTDTYRHLARTRWGLPPFRRLLPFLVIAMVPVVPFFALSDFGQMLIFFGVYIMLYAIAVRRKVQLLYALLLVVLVFSLFYIASSAKTGFGLPPRIYFRFYMWTHTWEPPSPDTWWWKRDYEKYLKAKNLPSPNDPQEIKQRNAEAWADKVLQQSQGLFGIHDGGIKGTGFGLGYPETIPISDSDFIYAALAEETGLLGALAVLIALVVFVFAGTAISIAAQDMFTKLLAAGFTSAIAFQAIVNIAGVLRLLPMTGITLPFVSHGGWSLMTSFAMLGALLAFAHRNALLHLSQKPAPGFIPVR
jgi:cell division protein FtsW (lipid II flippase)